MTVHVSDANSARCLSLSQRLALASGAAAAFAGVAAPQVAEAGIVQSTTLPLSPPASAGSILWDVDGDGTDDFSLINQGGTYGKFGALGNARFVKKSTVVNHGFAKLASGFNVGAVMPGYNFAAAPQVVWITSGGTTVTYVHQQGWSKTKGEFGFKFTTTSGVHYGWGTIDITGYPNRGYGYTLTDAYYEGVAGAAIAVGDTGSGAVPEIDPASAGSVLSLVMGSLAMLERRRMRRAADASTATVSA